MDHRESSDDQASVRCRGGTVLKEYAIGEKKIHVIDDLFPLQFRSDVYVYAKSSTFQLGWADTSIAENQHHKYLFAPYTQVDLEAMGMLRYLQDPRIQELIGGMKMSKCVLNVTTASDAHFAHAHPESKVVLYYVNQEWRDGWHGETLFFSENLKEIVHASVYTPGRIVVFDGNIPHAIRPQSVIGPQFRYTLAMVFDK
jgi:hypothetical protein